VIPLVSPRVGGELGALVNKGSYLAFDYATRKLFDLAAIEHHVQEVGTCPVIFDDILINSDDARAEAALRAIGELAKCTQVLFFTHHRRLAELGSNLGAQVLDLSSSALLSI